MIELFIVFGLPLLIFFCQPFGGRNRWLGWRFVVAIASVWFGLMCYREFVTLPMEIRQATESGDLDYDGVGGNAALLLLGWLPGLIGASVGLGIFSFHRRLQERRQRQPTAPASDEKELPDHGDEEERSVDPYVPPRP